MLESLLLQYCRLFEHQFGVRFNIPLLQYSTTHGEDEAKMLSETERRRVHLANTLDTKLYQYARTLFERRMKLVGL